MVLVRKKNVTMVKWDNLHEVLRTVYLEIVIYLRVKIQLNTLFCTQTELHVWIRRSLKNCIDKKTPKTTRIIVCFSRTIPVRILGNIPPLPQWHAIKVNVVDELLSLITINLISCSFSESPKTSFWARFWRPIRPAYKTWFGID